jgi:hypothetical protein
MRGHFHRDFSSNPPGGGDYGRPDCAATAALASDAVIGQEKTANS